MIKGKINLALMLIMTVTLIACNKNDAGVNSASSEPSASAEGCGLVSTIDGKPLAIKVTATDTAEAKEFLSTCNNPYTKIYAADATAAKAGRKVFTFNNCMGCHGGKLEGIMAPSLSKNTAGGQGAYDQKWVYEKNKTDKGMFETIAGGTPGLSGGTMFIWHKQLAGHTGDGLSTDDILKVIAYIRTEYKGDGEKAWLN
jgi:cytochrome c-L